MITLAIETSTTQGSIALLRDGECLLTKTFTSERSHNSQIFSPLGEALDIATPDLIAVGTGPGSYTGVRIGIAAGLGIAMAKNAPIAGIASICCPAAAGQSDTFSVVGDARRGAIFVARVSRRALVLEPELHPLEQLPPLEGVVLTHDPAPPIDSAIVTHPSAAKLAVLASTMDASAFDALAEIPPEPIYLRAPFITQPKKPGKSLPPQP